MASRSVRSGFARASRRVPRGAGIAAVGVLAAAIAIAAAGPGLASGATGRTAGHRTAGVGEGHTLAAAGATALQAAPQPASMPVSAPASAPLPALSQVRLERSAAARDLAELRKFRKKARAVGLPGDRPHERALAKALQHKIALLKKLERELLGDVPSERRTHPTTPASATHVTKQAKASADTARSKAKKNAATKAKRHGGAKEKAKKTGRRGRAVAYARAQIGKPYRWGGTGPGSFDCSGLVMSAWRHAGVSIPRITTSQWSAGKRISRSQLRRGDLIFRSGLGHVMLYAGNGRIIHAPHSGSTVQRGTLPPHSQVDGYVSVAP